MNSGARATIKIINGLIDFLNVAENLLLTLQAHGEEQASSEILKQSDGAFALPSVENENREQLDAMLK